MPISKQNLRKLTIEATVRNLDERADQELKARAALEGRSIGETSSDAIRCYVRSAPSPQRDGSLADLTPETYPPGNERLSEQIDAIVYGAS